MVSVMGSFSAASPLRAARDPRDWYTPLPKNGKHGSPLLRLFGAAPSELGYLSWGRRYYGEPPLPPRTHEGWHYFVVADGRPKLLVDTESVPTQPGTVSIGDPECPIGHRDEPGTACQMMTWIWRTPPSHSALRPPKSGCLRLELDPSQLRRLKHLHTQCRQAVADSNEQGMVQLRAARLYLDLCLLEALQHRPQPDERMRLDLAIQYLRNHIRDSSILPGLCEYLQVSKASLNRLFRKHTNKSPRAFAQELRMDWAHKQLSDPKKSVKAVAYELGYRHSPDFSRAFKHHFGISPSAIAPGQAAFGA
jgi:AraC family transcriptional regulator of arabinose operon